MSNRFVYWVGGDYDVIDGVKHYIPSIVYEGVAGHIPCRNGDSPGSLPYYWGTTEKECQEACDEANEKMGYTREFALDVVTSSMIAHKDLGI
jgi:hypothetical protein|tara:strand:+ start:974 stop:1249 length:276 start_codon:yes stop_codon:yes gene_type:complete